MLETELLQAKGQTVTDMPLLTRTALFSAETFLIVTVLSRLLSPLSIETSLLGTEKKSDNREIHSLFALPSSGIV